MKFVALICIWLMALLGDLSAQDSLQNHRPLSILSPPAILPMALVGAGIILSSSKFEKNLQENIRAHVGTDYEFPLDDFIQYAPIAELYTADLLGVKAKNHWFDQTKYLLISNFFTGVVTHALKRSIQKPRPNGRPYSFPSGHTSFAFTNATVLFNEFQESTPLLAYSGFVFSSTTAFFRVINNRHWVSDVLLGAGLGIGITQIIYFIKPLKNFNPFKKVSNLRVSPQITQEAYGIYICLDLR